MTESILAPTQHRQRLLLGSKEGIFMQTSNGTGSAADMLLESHNSGAKKQGQKFRTGQK